MSCCACVQVFPCSTVILTVACLHLVAALAAVCLAAVAGKYFCVLSTRGHW